MSGQGRWVHRQNRSGPACDLPRGLLSEYRFSGSGCRDMQGVHRHAECGDLRCGDLGRQLRSAALSRHDGQREDSDGEVGGYVEGPQLGPELSLQFHRLLEDDRCSAGSFRTFTVTAGPIAGSDCAHRRKGKASADAFPSFLFAFGFLTASQ